jgi:Zn ribbon nucleic-acid-binding protein
MARSSTRPSVPLGSLTQRDARPGVVCAACSSSRTTQLAMNLTDGTPVDFVSCHVCGHRSWTHEGVQLDMSDVLQRTRKVR